MSNPIHTLDIIGNRELEGPGTHTQRIPGPSTSSWWGADGDNATTSTPLKGVSCGPATPGRYVLNGGADTTDQRALVRPWIGVRAGVAAPSTGAARGGEAAHPPSRGDPSAPLPWPVSA